MLGAVFQGSIRLCHCPGLGDQSPHYHCGLYCPPGCLADFWESQCFVLLNSFFPEKHPHQEHLTTFSGSHTLVRLSVCSVGDT